MTLIKICGITNLEDAQLCVAAGADALGFNFYGPSPRYIDPHAARAIIDQLPEDLLTVGVFVNEPTGVVEQIAKEAGVSALQLHGDETPDYCRELTSRRIIKVLATGHDFQPENALAYDVDTIMLDAFDLKLRGGTGQTIDWHLARQTRDLVPRLILAGGLTPDNVNDAILAVNPYGVDACSSLENRPGRKTPERVKAFVEAVRASSTHL